MPRRPSKFAVATVNRILTKAPIFEKIMGLPILRNVNIRETMEDIIQDGLSNELKPLLIELITSLLESPE